MMGVRSNLVACAAASVMAAQSAAASQAATTPSNGGKPPKEAKEASVQVVKFDHLATEGDRAYVLRLSTGEPFQIKIANTCPDVFSYDVHGILREETEDGAAAAKAGKPLEEKVLAVVHDEKYGGYIVTIKRTADTNPCDKSDKLASRTLMISTPKMTWDLSFSGGFTLSSLTAPHYFVGPHPTETGKKQLQEDSAKKDDATLGIATYVHVYHHRWPMLAGTFGLGIRDENKTEYFLGGGLRFSDKASLNAGVVYGPVARLNDGVNVNDTVTDDNVLNDLKTRTTRGFFVGISYAFIDVRGKLQEPFAGSTGASGETGKSATGKTPPAGAVCQATFEKDPVTLAAAAGAQDTVKITVSPSGCDWKVTGGVPAWLTLDATSGKGDKTVTITTSQANGTASDRTAKLEIGGKLLTITQSK